MNVLETADLIDSCIALGIWRHPGDDDALQGQITMWHEALEEVPYGYAKGVVSRHVGPYMIRPSMIRGEWEQTEKSQRMQRGYDERACPWARLCLCTHTECYRGWLDSEQDRERTVVEMRPVGDTEIAYSVGRWCPVCHNARNARRAEQNKEPIPYGVIGPNR